MRIPSLALFAALSSASAASNECSMSPEDALAEVARITLSLKAAGYKVTAGKANWFLPFDGQGPENPSGTYMEYSFPTTAFPEPEFCDVNMETCQIPHLTQSVLLGASDALLYVGCTPPESRYFATDMMVSSRYGSTIGYTDDDPDSGIPSNWAPGCPFGDAHNHLAMQNFDWSSPLATITSFNSQTSSDVQAALADAGDTPSTVYALNSSLVYLWADKSESMFDTRPDSFRPLIRWSVPLDGTDADNVQEYYSQTWPVLLVAREEASDQDDALFEPELLPRGGHGINEVDELTETMKEVQGNLTKSFKTAGLTLSAESHSDKDFLGMGDDFARVLTDWNYGGDWLNTRDAVYGNPPDGGVSSDSFMSDVGVGVLVGIAHTKLKKSVYNNVGATTDDFSFVKWFTDSDMDELGCYSDESDDVFVIYYRYHNSPWECPEGAGCCLTMDTAPEGGSVLTQGERIYLDPKTKTGPGIDEVIAVDLLIFDDPDVNARQKLEFLSKKKE